MDKVEVDSLVKHYGEVVGVDGLSFSVREGELVSLLGPSGCGKSTTLRSIAGLERVTGGKIHLNDVLVSAGEDDVHVPPSERNLGMVFQSFALWPNKTVLENVRFGLEESPNIGGMSKEEMTSRSREYLELVDLGGYEDSSPRELSGGEQQRVALARALVYNPDVLLLDEPLSNLDAKLRKEARIWLKDIQEETGVTTLYVTHDQAEASALSDRMIILNSGQIEQTGTPEEVFEHPKNRFVADFLGKENFLEGTLTMNGDGSGVVSTSNGHELDVAPSQNGFADGDTVTIAIAPEEINIVDDSVTDNVVHGTITQKLYYGDKTELVMDVGGEEIIVVVIERVEDERGDEIALRLPPDKCALVT